MDFKHSMSNMNMEKPDTKIVGIDNILYILNPPSDFTLPNPNQIGHVINIADGKKISETTPLFMTIIQNRRERDTLIRRLLSQAKNPANMDLLIDWYGEKISARDLYFRSARKQWIDAAATGEGDYKKM